MWLLQQYFILMTKLRHHRVVNNAIHFDWWHVGNCLQRVVGSNTKTNNIIIQYRTCLFKVINTTSCSTTPHEVKLHLQLFFFQNLTLAMKTVCEILTTDLEGGPARIPFSLFKELYTYLAEIDGEIAKEHVDTVIEHLSYDVWVMHDKPHNQNNTRKRYSECLNFSSWKGKSVYVGYNSLTITTCSTKYLCYELQDTCGITKIYYFYTLFEGYWSNWDLVTIKPPILLGIIVLCQIIWTAFYFFFQGKTRWPSFSAELYEWQLSTIVTEWELVRKNVIEMFSFVSHLKNWNIPPFIVTMFNWNCLFYFTGEFCNMFYVQAIHWLPFLHLHT